MNDLERKIVDLVDEGLTRWKIADELGLGETTVRSVIWRLCDQHNCSMRDLPETIRREEEGDGSSLPPLSDE